MGYTLIVLEVMYTVIIQHHYNIKVMYASVTSQRIQELLGACFEIKLLN